MASFAGIPPIRILASQRTYRIGKAKAPEEFCGCVACACGKASGTMTGRVRIVKWNPPTEPLEVTARHLVPEPGKLAKIVVVRLQLALTGRGCGCCEPAELIGLLKDLGV